jgi:hypothetical protein
MSVGVGPDGAGFDPDGLQTEFGFRVGDAFARHGTRSERWNDSDRERLISHIIARRKEAWRCEQVEELAAQARLRMSMTQLTRPGHCSTRALAMQQRGTAGIAHRLE